MLRLRAFGYVLAVSFRPNMPPLAFWLEVRRAERFAEPVLFQVRYTKGAGWYVGRPVLTGGYSFG